MIVDTSAIVAILNNEPEYEDLATAIESAPICRLSAASLVEVFLVVEGSRNEVCARGVDNLLLAIQPTIEPVTESQARIARAAFRQYGKGMGHPAQPNFGDCFAYALARDRNEPLLFTGEDFAQTDIRPAIARS